MTYDAKINKPEVASNGLSDPVTVYMDNGEVIVAWWDNNEKKWCATNRFGFSDSVLHWSPIEFPVRWSYDPSFYGGE